MGPSLSLETVSLLRERAGFITQCLKRPRKGEVPMGWRHFLHGILGHLGFYWKKACGVNQHRLSRWCSDYYFPCIEVKIKLKPQETISFGSLPGSWASPPQREVPSRLQQFFYGIAETHFDLVTFGCNVSALIKIHLEKSHFF